MARRHVRTKYFEVDTSKCTACGKCIDECLYQVFKIVGVKFLLINHRHIKVVKPDDCVGCLLCLDVCPENAILETA